MKKKRETKWVVCLPWAAQKSNIKVFRIGAGDGFALGLLEMQIRKRIQAGVGAITDFDMKHPRGG